MTKTLWLKMGKKHEQTLPKSRPSNGQGHSCPVTCGGVLHPCWHGPGPTPRKAGVTTCTTALLAVDSPGVPEVTG